MISRMMRRTVPEEWEHLRASDATRAISALSLLCLTNNTNSSFACGSAFLAVREKYNIRVWHDKGYHVTLKVR